ncbi:hypothetical protein CSB09_03590 [Candidatus Gracilibacteria bacterium]|nr:MAG: hypothetical protein CSB09_03590 [Candidatus Gracilibacteria bacterium]
MLDSIISFLQKLKQQKSGERISIFSGPESKTGKVFFFLIYLLCTLLFIYIIIIGWMKNNYFDKSELYGILSFLGIIFALLLLFIVPIFLSQKNRTWKFLFTIHIPLIFSVLSIGIFFLTPQFRVDTLVGMLVGIYPLFQIAKAYAENYNIAFVERKWMMKGISFFQYYNYGFFFFLATFVFLLSIGFESIFSIEIDDVWFLDELHLLISNISDMISGGVVSFLFFNIIFFLFLCYAVLGLHMYRESISFQWNSLFKGVSAFLVLFLLVYSINSMKYLYTYQVNTAEEIIMTEGDNYESYKKAKGKWFLERAYLYHIKHKENINHQTFSKLFDATVQQYFGEKVADYLENPRTFATNASKIGEKAEVEFSFIDIKNSVIQENGIPLLETMYTFDFTNETNENKEVIIDFEAPSKDTVVTNLRLGKNLELIGQIAPRGAARQVYENSLRRNTDPALIEKVGLNSYNLRVFPIPQKTDYKSNGKQKVQIKMITPFTTDAVLYSPQFTVVNLKYNENSNLVSKIYKGNELIKEEKKKGKDIEKYTKENHFISLQDLGVENRTSFDSICLNSELQSIYDTISYHKNQEYQKIIVLFDNSLSVERNNAHKIYEDIYSVLKNFDGKLRDIDMYSYNFDTRRISEIADIKYWGYSDIDNAVEFIIENSIENSRIIFVTDDDSFNFSSQEDGTRDFTKLASNQLSVIKIGNKVKKYKSDFNTLLAATAGNIYTLSQKGDIESTLQQIFSVQPTHIKTGSQCRNIHLGNSENGAISKINQIQAGIISTKLLSAISNRAKWDSVAEQQNALAERYHIVNQFNSIIALETDRQQRDLDRYSQSNQAYDIKYSDSSRTKRISWQTNRTSRPTTDNFSLSFDKASSLDIEYDSSLIGAPSRTSDFDFDFDFHPLALLIIGAYLVQYILYIMFFFGFSRKEKESENTSNT